MLARSVRNPLVIGLGTGVILIIGAIPPVLAESASPTPTSSGSSSTTSSASPSGTPTPTPTPTKNPTLTLKFLHVPSVGQPGTSYSMDVYIKVSDGTLEDLDLTLWSSRAKATFDSNKRRDYHFDKLSGPKRLPMTVAVPSSVTSGTVTVDAYVDVGSDEIPAKLSFAVKKPKTSSSHSSSSGSSSGSSGSSGTNNNPTPPADLNSGSAGPAPSVAPANNTVLPGINQQNQGQTPSAVPLVQTTGNAQLMSGSADGPDELTFDKLASTQAAWLAALLVAFSLLLTQVRLGKANVRAAKPARPKGAHRRSRRRRPGSRVL